jgi:hypothetical protein
MGLKNVLWCLCHARITRIDRTKKYIVALDEPLTPEMLAQITTWFTQPDVPLLLVRGPVQIVEGVVGKDVPDATV